MSLTRPAAANGAPPLFADVAGDIDVSFEFFPPKTEKMEQTLWASVQTLAPLEPRFVSVTYGAGGSTRERTHATVARIARETPLAAAAHLTCVEATRARSTRSPATIGKRAYATSSRCAAIPPGWASLCRRTRRLCQRRRAGRGLKKVAPFEISVAAYPECHPDSPQQRRRPR
jgi:methylenetetrahydrofolate reductase (NADPH)